MLDHFARRAVFFAASFMACADATAVRATEQAADQPHLPVAREEQLAVLAREVKPPPGFTGTLFASPTEANYPVFVAATADLSVAQFTSLLDSIEGMKIK